MTGPHTQRRQRQCRGSRAGLLLTLLVLLGTPFSANAMRIAYGDIPSIESLNLLIAMERARERGVDVELSYFDSEDVAAQAVVGGEADIGIGAPYALIQRVRTPIRLIYQISTLRFFPVVNTEYYQNWEDLDGEPVAVHSRGSGTEAFMRLMAQRHDIDYANISYIPGSEVRAGAMLQGNVRATIVDSAAWRLLQEEGGDRFKRLPSGDVSATDEAMYANVEFIESNPEDLQILLEEMLRTWRDINDNPELVTELREKYDLLPDLPADMEGEILPFYQDAVENDLFPNDGGSPGVVRDDLSFYAVGGQIEGDPESLNIEDFWTFDPLQQSRSALGDG